MDIVERLSFDAARCELQFSKGIAGNIEEARAEIERLRAENAHLQFCLNSRDDFLGRIGQWQAYCDTLPHKTAGVPGGWSK